MQKLVGWNAVRQQLGVTILEFIAFIGLAALVIAGALSLYGSGVDSAKVQEMRQVAAAIATQVRQKAAAAGSYSTVSMAGIQPPAGWEHNSAKSNIHKNTEDGYNFTFEGVGATQVTLTFTSPDEKSAAALEGFMIGNSSGTYTANQKVTKWILKDAN